MKETRGRGKKSYATRSAGRDLPEMHKSFSPSMANSLFFKQTQRTLEGKIVVHAVSRTYIYIYIYSFLRVPLCVRGLRITDEWRCTWRPHIMNSQHQSAADINKHDNYSTHETYSGNGSKQIRSFFFLIKKSAVQGRDGKKNKEYKCTNKVKKNGLGQR